MDYNSGYNVVFAINERYAKYLSVMITSIIYSLKDTFFEDKKEYLKDYELVDSGISKNAPFFFHILTDGISKETADKFKELEKELSKVYKVSIIIYKVADTVFKEKQLQRLKGYSTYFRFFIPEVLKGIKKILYLDTDMVAMDDIRIIWHFDMRGKVVAVVKDIGVLFENATSKNKVAVERIRKAKKKGRADFFFKGNDYFNAGFILIEDNEKFKDIVKDAFEFLDNYKTLLWDQDALNAVIADEDKLYLPASFNLMRHTAMSPRCKVGRGDSIGGIPADEMITAAKNAVICHSAGRGLKFWDEMCPKSPAKDRWMMFAEKDTDNKLDLFFEK